MGDKKPSYAQKNKQNRKPHVYCVKDPHFKKDMRINLRKAKFKSKRQAEPGPEFDSESEPTIKPQPQRDRLSDDNISDVEESGQDFENLLNAPISEGGHFTFKSEKNFNFDISESSHLFSLNLKLLNAAVSCIPFNECIGIEDKYFSNDQLTYMRSEAETANQNYEKIVKNILKIEKLDSDNDLDSKIREDFGREKKQKSERRDLESSEIQSLEEDLDFLLSLKEPLVSGPIAIPKTSSNTAIEEPKPTSAPVKSIDLEKWLDSVLDI